MWEGASLWIVAATPAADRKTQSTDFHAHHAIQVTLSLGGRFRLEGAGVVHNGEAAAVAADAQHRFEAEGLVALLFIEPESNVGRAITRRHFKNQGLIAIEHDVLSGCREGLAAAHAASKRDDAALIQIGREMVAALGPDTASDQPDARIQKVIAWAARQVDQPVGLSDAVTVSGLSASRLRHLFVEQTGLPFKTYLLWLRLTRAVEGVAAGASLTQAAHEAGFSDSAHLSRTFRRMFGVAPAALRVS